MEVCPVVVGPAEREGTGCGEAGNVPASVVRTTRSLVTCVAMRKRGKREWAPCPKGLGGRIP